MNISDLGLEIILHPVLQVRIQHHGGQWYVEYRRKPRYFFDKWWWFDDSKHPDYNSAFVRAQMIAAEGGFKEVRHVTKVFNANISE